MLSFIVPTTNQSTKERERETEIHFENELTTCSASSCRCLPFSRLFVFIFQVFNLYAILLNVNPLHIMDFQLCTHVLVCTVCVCDERCVQAESQAAATQCSQHRQQPNGNNNNRKSTIRFIYHYGTMLRYLPSTSTCLCVHTVHIATHMVLYLVVYRLTAITSRQAGSSSSIHCCHHSQRLAVFSRSFCFSMCACMCVCLSLLK